MPKFAHDRQTLFLAFADSDAGAVSGIAAELRRCPKVNLDYGVCSEPFDTQRADIVRASLLRRLRRSAAALCLFGEHTPCDDWVLWALDAAHHLKVPTLGASLVESASPQAHALLDLVDARMVPLETNAIIDHLPWITGRRDVPSEAETASPLHLMKHILR